jgi:hypothetical protein
VDTVPTLLLVLLLPGAEQDQEQDQEQEWGLRLPLAQTRRSGEVRFEFDAIVSEPE